MEEFICPDDMLCMTEEKRYEFEKEYDIHKNGE